MTIRRTLCLLATLTASALTQADLLEPDKGGPLINEKRLGELICLSAMRSDEEHQGGSINITAVLNQIAGKRLQLRINTITGNPELPADGNVVLSGVVFRRGEVLWVDRDGWHPCST